MQRIPMQIPISRHPTWCSPCHFCFYRVDVIGGDGHIPYSYLCATDSLDFDLTIARQLSRLLVLALLVLVVPDWWPLNYFFMTRRPMLLRCIRCIKGSSPRVGSCDISKVLSLSLWMIGG